MSVHTASSPWGILQPRFQSWVPWQLSGLTKCEFTDSCFPLGLLDVDSVGSRKSFQVISRLLSPPCLIFSLKLLLPLLPLLSNAADNLQFHPCFLTKQGSTLQDGFESLVPSFSAVLFYFATESWCIPLSPMNDDIVFQLSFGLFPKACNRLWPCVI